MNPLESMIDRSEFGKCLNEMRIGGIGVEVGVFKGEFSAQILRDWPGTLIGIDSYNQGTDFHLLIEAIQNNFLAVHDDRYKIIVHESPAAVLLVPDELSFVYIDSSHLEHETKVEMYSWWPKVRRGGILCGHDYDDKDGGVFRAVNEFMAMNPKLTLFEKPCGSWFVQKI